MSTSGSDAYTMSADAMSQAGQGAANAMAYQPMQVKAPTAQGAAPVGTSTVAGANMGAYMNPYTDQVVQSSQQALFDANQQNLNATGASAEAAGAFGGSRHGVAEAQTNQGYLDANARMTADLYSQGYTQAQGMAAADAAAKNQTAMFNAGQTQQNNQFNATNGMSAQLANQSAGLQGAQTNLAGATALSGIGNTGFNQANTLTSQQLAMGNQQQLTNQAILDQQAAMWNGYTGAPGVGLGYNAGAVGTVGASAPTTESTTSDPGLFGWTNMFLGL